MAGPGPLVGDRIGRLALVGWPEGEPPPALDSLAPPALDAEAVLVVRRMAVVTTTGQAPTAVLAEVAALTSTAARPTRGRVDPGCTAVLFANSAELLACYLLSLRQPELVPAWVWTQLTGSLPPPALAPLLRDPATPVTATLAVLDRWGRLDAVVGGLDFVDSRRVVEAVADHHDLWVREKAGPPPMSAATGRPGAPPPARVPGAISHGSGWEIGRRGSAQVLAHVPAGPGFADSLGLLLVTVLGSVSGYEGRAAAAEPTVAWRVPSGRDERRPPTPEAPPISDTLDDAAAAPARPDDLPQGPTGKATVPARVPAVTIAWSAPAVGRPDPRGPLPVTPPSEAARNPEEHGSVAPAGLATGTGGVLYLVNPYRRLDLVAAGLADAPPWDVIDGLGRAALETLPGSDALDPGDVLWDVLAGLAGRAPGERPAPAVLAACRRALAGILDDLDLGPNEPPLGQLVQVSGHLHVNLTRVELVAPLEAVHLSVRRRALDADPGWVPALGRVIRFRFIGGSGP